MENTPILKLLEQQRDGLYKSLNTKPISILYKEQYEDISAGKVFILDNGERQILSDLKKLSKDTSKDLAYKAKLTEYVNLENEILISHFQTEFERLFEQMIGSKTQAEIQAIFIEYDYYYDFTGSVTCYGRQEYPIVVEPRYISNEFDYTKQIMFLDNAINFQPAWVNCEEFGELNYLDINLKLETLFQLHSRVLMHKALERLNIEGKMNFIKNRPFSFYVNEHDCEVMMLYRMN